mgnify:CR=1 FL=1
MASRLEMHMELSEELFYIVWTKQIPIDDMSLEELKTFSPVFEEDIYDAISMETCVNKRLTVGAPGEEAMKKVIAENDAYLVTDWQDEITIPQDVQE